MTLKRVPIAGERSAAGTGSEGHQVAGGPACPRLGGDLDWELEEGAPLRFTPAEPADGPEREGRIEEVDPGRYLRFSWWPTDDDAGTSEVVYMLEPEPDGSTTLTVEELPLVWSCADTGMLNAWAVASCVAKA